MKQGDYLLTHDDVVDRADDATVGILCEGPTSRKLTPRVKGVQKNPPVLKIAYGARNFVAADISQLCRAPGQVGVVALGYYDGGVDGTAAGQSEARGCLVELVARCTRQPVPVLLCFDNTPVENGPALGCDRSRPLGHAFEVSRNRLDDGFATGGGRNERPLGHFVSNRLVTGVPDTGPNWISRRRDRSGNSLAVKSSQVAFCSAAADDDDDIRTEGLQPADRGGNLRRSL